MTELVMPDSDYCYETRVFGEGKQCPDFDGTVSMVPRCRKYDKRLSWTRSGLVLKCEECQGPEGIDGRISRDYLDEIDRLAHYEAQRDAWRTEIVGHLRKQAWSLI